jgi:hypothetical protein
MLMEDSEPAVVLPIVPAVDTHDVPTVGLPLPRASNTVSGTRSVAKSHESTVSKSGSPGGVEE